MREDFSEGAKLALDSIMAFPDQCLQAWEDIKKLPTPSGYENIENIIVCGMGGSRFTPLSIKECFSDRIKIPYEVLDGYNLPKYVNDKTLVILSSYSGTTEEVISCAKEARAKKAKIAAVTKGGEIEIICKENAYFSYIFKELHNPSDQPRLGVGYMLFGHLGLLHKLNLIEIDEKEILDSINHLKGLDLEHHAKELSQKMLDNEIFVVVSEHLKGFANGFANQINENAKAMSSYRFLSELNHHLLEGLTNPVELKKHWLFVLVNSPLYSPRVAKRYPITSDVIIKQGVSVYEYKISGKSKFSDLLEAFALSGLATFYLSLLYKVDPTKIPWVDYFKKELGTFSS